MLVHAGLSTLLVSLGESDQLSTPLPPSPTSPCTHFHFLLLLLRSAHTSPFYRQILVPRDQVCYTVGGERSVCPWGLWEAARVGPGGQRLQALTVLSWMLPRCPHLPRSWGAWWDGG